MPYGVDLLVGPAAYFDGYDSKKDKQECELKLKPFSKNDVIVLGRPFLRHYISMFDVEKR